MTSRSFGVVLACAAAASALSCKDSSGPGGGLIIGRYGNAEQHVELAAIHAGVELSEPCGGYFASEDPLLLAEDQTVEVRGQWHATGFGIPIDPQPATLSGSYTDGVLHLSLAVRGGDDPVPLTLTLGESGHLDEVVCALVPGR